MATPKQRAEAAFSGKLGSDAGEPTISLVDGVYEAEYPTGWLLRYDEQAARIVRRPGAVAHVVAVPEPVEVAPEPVKRKRKSRAKPKAEAE